MLPHHLSAACTSLSLALSAAFLPAQAQETGEVEIPRNENGRVVLIFNGHPMTMAPGPKPEVFTAETAPGAPSWHMSERAAPELGTSPQTQSAPRKTAPQRVVRYMTEEEWAAFQARHGAESD